MYVKGLPICSECSKCIIQAGVKCVVVELSDETPEKWADQWKKTSEPMFNEAGVEIKYFSRHK
jgi:deoxycytidylate deaminase